MRNFIAVGDFAKARRAWQRNIDQDNEESLSQKELEILESWEDHLCQQDREYMEMHWGYDAEMFCREAAHATAEREAAEQAAEAAKAFAAFMAATPIVDLTPQWLKDVRRIEQLLAQ